MSHTLLLSNPQSGRNRHGLEAVEAVAGQCGMRCERPTLAELGDAVSRWQGEEVGRIIVNGGDGTLVALVEALYAHWQGTLPLLAVLPGGTTNLVCKDIGWQGCRKRSLKRIANSVSENTRTRAPLSVRVEGDTAPRIGFFLGLAAMPRAIRFARACWHSKGMHGSLSELLVFAKVLWSLAIGRVERDPLLQPVSMQCNGQEMSPMVVGFVTCLERLVFGIRPLATPVKVCFVGLHTPYGELRKLLSAILLRQPLSDIRGLQRINAETLALQLDSDWVLDGELINASPNTLLQISQAPALRFLVP